MRCGRIKKRMSAFLDGEVGEKEKKRIAGHLKTCRSCGEEAKTLSLLWALLAEEKESIRPSPYFWNKLEQRIVEVEENKNVFGKFLERLNRAFVPATATAVLVIGLFIGIQLGEVVYSGIAKVISPDSSSLAQKEVDQSLYLSALDDFPGESIGGVYTALITEGKSPQRR